MVTFNGSYTVFVNVKVNRRLLRNALVIFSLKFIWKTIPKIGIVVLEFWSLNASGFEYSENDVECNEYVSTHVELRRLPMKLKRKFKRLINLKNHIAHTNNINNKKNIYKYTLKKIYTIIIMLLALKSVSLPRALKIN